LKWEKIDLKNLKLNYKQCFLIVIAFFLIFMGYFNYGIEKDYTETSSVEIASRVDEDETTLGDVELVSAVVSNEEIDEVEEIKEDEEPNENQENEEALESDNIQNINNYFEESKLDRDRMYSESIETYQKLINNQETPTDQKAIAAQEITNITNIKNGIMISENLIKNKGFSNVVILVNNGIVNVVVEASTLKQEEISQIQNIIERQLNVDIKNISITNKY
jgi:hypothetical protein